MRTGVSSRLWPIRRWTTGRSRSCCQKTSKAQGEENSGVIRHGGSWAEREEGLSDDRCITLGLSLCERARDHRRTRHRPRHTARVLGLGPHRASGHRPLGRRGRFRALTIVDDYSRECPAIEVDTSLGGVRVVGVLERLAETRGLPEVITTAMARAMASSSTSASARHTWATLGRYTWTLLANDTNFGVRSKLYIIPFPFVGISKASTTRLSTRACGPWAELVRLPPELVLEALASVAQFPTRGRLFVVGSASPNPPAVVPVPPGAPPDR